MIYLFLANGFEEVEALGTLDVLRRAEMILAGAQQRIFDGVHHHILADVLLLLKNIQRFH